jgi:hypothetical protein
MNPSPYSLTKLQEVCWSCVPIYIGGLFQVWFNNWDWNLLFEYGKVFACLTTYLAFRWGAYVRLRASKSSKNASYSNPLEW